MDVVQLQGQQSPDGWEGCCLLILAQKRMHCTGISSQIHAHIVKHTSLESTTVCVYTLLCQWQGLSSP